MITFGLVSLFFLTAIVAAISLSDSALRGTRAFKQLSEALQNEQTDALESPAEQLMAAKSVQQNVRAPRSKRKPSMDYLQLLPVAA